MNGRKIGKSYGCCLCKYCAPGRTRSWHKKIVRRLERRVKKTELRKEILGS